MIPSAHDTEQQQRANAWSNAIIGAAIEIAACFNVVYSSDHKSRRHALRVRAALLCFTSPCCALPCLAGLPRRLLLEGTLDRRLAAN